MPSPLDKVGQTFPRTPHFDTKYSGGRPRNPRIPCIRTLSTLREVLRVRLRAAQMWAAAPITRTCCHYSVEPLVPYPSVGQSIFPIPGRSIVGHGLGWVSV